MVGINKVVSWAVLICFLFNTAVSDLAFGLAVPSQLTDITGIQSKDIGKIKLTLETILKEQNFDKKLAGMKFFFHEQRPTGAGTSVMVRLKDLMGTRTYYATFSLQKDADDGFPINVYTEEQYKGSTEFAAKDVTSSNYVYFFGDGKTSAEELFKGDLDSRKVILGGKGEGLHSMTRAKISVPPGFTITTDACNYYSANGQKWPTGLDKEVNSNLARMEKLLNKKLGDTKDPLLVSVRSGAKFSMPGMMDTILNLGLNDDTVLVFANKTGNERLAWDSYRRLIQMFSNVVLGIDKDDFEKIIESKKEELGVKQDVELDAEALKDLVAKFKALVESRGKAFPQNVNQQLIMAVNAVFESWNNTRAITYRKLNKISNDLGTAVNVQAMVFGNTGNKSGTGVGFTRNPSTGVKEPFGDFLINAQGEDVVAGSRTPQPISQLKEVMPEAYRQLIKITDGLEEHYRDVQDFEFTIEDGKLYLLQTRSGKRTGVAAVKAAVDMVKEGLITKEEALMRVDPKQLNEVLFPILDPQAKKSLTPKEILATGLSAGPGAATGQIVFTSEDAVEWTNKGKQVILWRKETCPDDIAGMDKAIGVGTSIGGMASHAALVARGMGKVTMVGAGQVDVNYEKKEAYAKDKDGKVIHTLKEGDWITLNVVEKEPAQLILGKKDIVRPEAIGGELGEFLSWAKDASRLRVWANAEIPNDAKKAFGFGAEGIGLCRTEHMFFGEDRLPIMQEMILADTVAERESALDKLLPMQREDFIGLFKEMKGYPVTIRTLDPPLHEFLPKREELMVEIKGLEMTLDNLNRPQISYRSIEENNVSNLIKEKKKLLSRINELHEFNPMMGMRGTRLGIMMPEITAMQARAIAEAAVAVIKDGGNVVPEIMIPLVGKLEEFTHQKKVVVDVVEKVMKESGVSFKYHIGTMIEVPRGALTADELATEAEFFSFGTNDLTQYGAGFSRDDIGKFMSHYLSLGIYPVDPFETFDAKGIGELVRIAVEKGRKTNPNLKIGICGEHGGDPDSIKFFHEVGLNYVSCSPYRVLGAWLAAAQAAIKERLSKSTEQVIHAKKFTPTKGDRVKTQQKMEFAASKSADSRGKPTVEVVLKVGDLEAKGDVPAGASKGQDEAQTVDVEQAIKNINEVIAPMLNQSGLNLRNHADLIGLEKRLIAAAGDNFKTLGANATVPVSRALWKMAAKLHGMELDEYIQAYEPDAVDYNNPDIVRFFMNIYNGGLHALKEKEGEELGKDRIDIQEIMIVPMSNKTYQEGLEMGDRIDAELKKILAKNYEADKITRADEAGFSVKGLGSSEQAIEYVFQAIEQAGYKVGKDVKLALDVAASSFYDEEKGTYKFQGKDLTSDEMIAFYVGLVQKYSGKIISIEDGLAENDWAGWKKLTEEMKELKAETIGDDLFVTQFPRLEKGIKEESASSILIKVNQNGTMYGTLEVIKRAKQAGMKWVVSHRSGETMDSSITDLAIATRALGEKTGDPQPDYDFGKGGQYEGKPLVRRVKYERALEIEKRERARLSSTEKTQAGNGASDEIAAMASLVSGAGVAISMERYNLLFISEFFANSGELDEHRAEYGDRFGLAVVSGASDDQFIDNILAKANGEEAKTIALIPDTLPIEQLEKLTKVGIRFVRVNAMDLQNAKTDKDASREKFQIDTYAMMLLLRRVDNSITVDSDIYRLLSFYLKSHFELTDKIAVDDYITAVVNSDVMRLIKGCLAYRPAQPYKAPDYNNIAAALISA